MELGLTIDQVAKPLNVHPQAVYVWENKAPNGVPVARIVAMAAVLKVDVERLFAKLFEQIVPPKAKLRRVA